MLIVRMVGGALWASVLIAAAQTASGQSTTSGAGRVYPNKPIRILSNEPGAGNDFVARLVAQGISEPLGQAVIVENRPGVYSTSTAAKATPDGYTMLSQGQSMWLTPYMRDNVPWSVSDFSPITIMMQGPNILVVHPSVPAKSVKELIALAKAKPGELNYSAGTRGSAVHLASELFKLMAGVNIVSVAYKGGTAATNAVIGGEVQVSFPTATGVSPQLKSGKLRALAVTSAQPSALLPGLPTVASAGLPGYESVNYTGLFVPARTPANIIRRLNEESVRALSRADVKEKLANIGAEVVANMPEQAATTIKSEMTRMGKVIKDAGIRAD